MEEQENRATALISNMRKYEGITDIYSEYEEKGMQWIDGRAWMTEGLAHLWQELLHLSLTGPKERA